MANLRDYTIASTDRSLSVLEILAQTKELGVTEISKHLGATRSLTFRMLKTLESRGYITQNDVRGTYSLGHRAIILGNHTSKQSELLRLSEPVLSNLSNQINENVNLIVRSGVQIMVVAFKETTHTVRVQTEIGLVGPLHSGGAATVLLANAPEDIQRQVLEGELEKFTEETITDPVELQRAIDYIRENRIYVAVNHYKIGMFSVAAPVFGTYNTCVAALSITGPVSRFDDVVEADLCKRVGRAAAHLSGLLGA